MSVDQDRDRVVVMIEAKKDSSVCAIRLIRAAEQGCSLKGCSLKCYSLKGYSLKGYSLKGCSLI